MTKLTNNSIVELFPHVLFQTENVDCLINLKISYCKARK